MKNDVPPDFTTDYTDFNGFHIADLRMPFRKVAVFEQGRAVARLKPVPKWLRVIAQT